MSIKLMNLVWGNRVTKSARDRLVLLALADMSNDIGVCWPSYPHLLKKCNMGKTSLWKALSNLESSGLIEVYAEVNDHNYYLVTVEQSDLDVIVGRDWLTGKINRKKREKKTGSLDVHPCKPPGVRRGEHDPSFNHHKDLKTKSSLSLDPGGSLLNDASKHESNPPYVLDFKTNSLDIQDQGIEKPKDEKPKNTIALKMIEIDDSNPLDAENYEYYDTIKNKDYKSDHNMIIGELAYYFCFLCGFDYSEWEVVDGASTQKEQRSTNVAWRIPLKLAYNRQPKTLEKYKKGYIYEIDRLRQAKWILRDVHNLLKAGNKDYDLANPRSFVKTMLHESIPTVENAILERANENQTRSPKPTMHYTDETI